MAASAPDSTLLYRIDSLRRHVEDKHAAEMTPTWKCGHPACREMDPLKSPKSFLRHAAKVHNYDMRMRPGHRGPRGPLVMIGHNKMICNLKDGA